MKEQSLTYTKMTFVLTLTYVLMDNFLSLFLLLSKLYEQVKATSIVAQ